MLFVCIPVHNEAQTAGLVLWRIRKAFAEFPREYELLVYNDGSSDATAEVLAPYADALPVTILGGQEHVGYARAIDALLRAALERCRYPRRDAVILMQGDFTDQPEHIAELVKRFEGGADIVAGESSLDHMPKPVRQLHRMGRWLARRFARVPGVTDLLGSFRLFRVTVVRDAVRAAGDKAIVEGDGVGANVDLLLAMAPHARRIETVALQPRYDLRMRESRIRPWHDAFRLYRFGREARARRPQLRLAEPA
ncbi:MAG TPA: glycosyltransferase family 2 protein [Gemmatimonadaceae bacterium]